jgi:hypothetical protein
MLLHPDNTNQLVRFLKNIISAITADGLREGYARLRSMIETFTPEEVKLAGCRTDV